MKEEEVPKEEEKNENDKKTFYDIHLKDNQKYNQIDSKVKDFLIKNEKIAVFSI